MNIEALKNQKGLKITLDGKILEVGTVSQIGTSQYSKQELVFLPDCVIEWGNAFRIDVIGPKDEGYFLDSGTEGKSVSLTFSLKFRKTPKGIYPNFTLYHLSEKQ